MKNTNAIVQDNLLRLKTLREMCDTYRPAELWNAYKGRFNNIPECSLCDAFHDCIGCPVHEHGGRCGTTSSLVGRASTMLMSPAAVDVFKRFLEIAITALEELKPLGD